MIHLDESAVLYGIKLLAVTLNLHFTSQVWQLTTAATTTVTSRTGMTRLWLRSNTANASLDVRNVTKGLHSLKMLEDTSGRVSGLTSPVRLAAGNLTVLNVWGSIKKNADAAIPVRRRLLIRNVWQNTDAGNRQLNGSGAHPRRKQDALSSVASVANDSRPVAKSTDIEWRLTASR